MESTAHLEYVSGYGCLLCRWQGLYRILCLSDVMLIQHFPSVMEKFCSADGQVGRRGQARVSNNNNVCRQHVLICSNGRGQVKESLKRWNLWREEEWRSVGARQNTCVTVPGL